VVLGAFAGEEPEVALSGLRELSVGHSSPIK
jgi:hypothetical protein